MILLDANVLVANFDLDAHGHEASRAVLIAATHRRLPGVLVPQVLLEAYAVLTDSRRVKAPLTPAVAWTELDGLTRAVPVVYPQRQAFVEFARVVSLRGPTAQTAFDAFLVAQMRASTIGTICTYDTGGFSGYEGISAETPETVVARYGLRD